MPPTQRPQDAWKADAPVATARARSGTARRWLWAALVLAALAGVIAGLFVYLRPDPEPILLAIPVTQYAHPDWSPNPWAEADARGLRERFGGDSAQAFQVQEKARILRELTRAADDSRGTRRPLVVYFSALGVAVEGTVYLLPGDARPDDKSGWLPLDDLLQPLRRTDALRMLVLDVRPVRSPRTVLPTEDVNEALDEALAKLDEAGDLPFFVLSANTPPDGANVIRPLKRTAFGLALAQAASGAADGWSASGSKDGRVSVSEFVAYVREVTHALSIIYGHPPQVPRLHGKGSEFFLLNVPAGVPTLPTLPDPEPYPDWLRDSWKDRDEWTKGALHRRAPRLMHQFARSAVRAEERWLAGHDAKAAGDLFLPALNELRETSRTLRAPVPLARSVTRVRSNPTVDVKAAEGALRPVFDKIREPAGAKKDELTPLLQAAWAKPADAAPFDATAAAIFGFALGLEDPTIEQMRLLSALAGGFRPKPRHPELLALDLVAGLPPELAARWPAGTTRRFLLTARAAEEAVCFDGRSLPWVRRALESADQARWKAVRVLCDPESPDESLRNAVSELDRAAGEYNAVRDATDALASARVEFEETRAAITDLAVAYPHNLAPVPEAVATAWAALVEDFRRLGVLLRAPTEPVRVPVDELVRVAQSVRANRERLRGFVQVPAAATPRQLESALAWPYWTGAERAQLFARLDATSRDAASRMLTAWPAHPCGAEPTVPARSGTRIARDSVRDVRRMVDLVRLADAPDAAQLVTKAAALGESNPREVTELLRQARAAWRTKLADEYRTAAAPQQAAVGWAVDPDDVPAIPRPGLAGQPNPELPQWRAAEKAFHLWLGEFRYKGEAAALRAVDTKAARDHATALDSLARDFRDWSP